MYQGTREVLFYGPQPVAEFQMFGHAWSVRTSIHRMLHQHRQARLSSRILAVRYCEAYVKRWEAEIREGLSHFGDVRFFGEEYGPRERPKPDWPETTHRRRARRSRLA